VTEHDVDLDAALDLVVAKMRAHLAAVKAAEGRIDDDTVWKCYVELNNASFAYDDLLLDAFGEVTPWDVDLIDPELADEKLGAMADLASATDPHTHVVSVRQRRDYRVPSVAALIKKATNVRRESMGIEDGADDPVESVGEAVLELLQSGDGSLAALDVPELEPMDGVVAVAEVDTPLDLEAFDETDGSGPFALESPARIVGRLDEHPYADLDDDAE
jgi:hypothetical protein